MDARQQKGLEIAATLPLKKQADGTWSVPSQSLNGRYQVTMADDGPHCTCPDFELRGQRCKHGYAVEYVIKRETITETTPQGDVKTTVTETVAARVTYAQNWPAYNAAQTTEKDHFCRLLRDLVANIPTPAQQGAGQRRLPMPDLIFAAAYKVYSGFSGRRFMCDLRAARDNGLVGYAASYNAMFDVMQLESLTPILHDLIATTARPLATVETQFAVDSTGLGKQCFYRHYSAKYGHDQYSRDYLKIHAMIGTKTNVVTAVAITDRNANDGPQFPALVDKTAETFSIQEVSADKAYLTVTNLTTVSNRGATPFVPFKSNSTGNSESPLWNKLHAFFTFKRDEFLPHYHRRSNIESTFSMLKRVIGDTLRSKTPVAQINEALLMVLCHNIRCLIHEMFELGINPAF
jgi:transposase